MIQALTLTILWLLWANKSFLFLPSIAFSLPLSLPPFFFPSYLPSFQVFLSESESLSDKMVFPSRTRSLRKFSTSLHSSATKQILLSLCNMASTVSEKRYVKRAMRREVAPQGSQHLLGETVYQHK